MNKKLGLLALSSALLLAACGPQNTPTPPTAEKPPVADGKLKAVATPGAYYVNAAGERVTITQDMLQNAGSNFVFYAWMENEAGGINPANVGTAGDPGTPTEEERIEYAPIQNQNLLAGYVGYRDASGAVFPVVGANVRWDIREDAAWENDGYRGLAMQFSAADDGGQPSGSIRPADINDRAKSASTWTNSATGFNERFPSSPSNPFYNRSGVTTPDRDGFTWTTLFSPLDVESYGKVTAIAYINGTEVNKAFVEKHFAPQARIILDKTITAEGESEADRAATPDAVTVTLNNGQPTATTTATIRVRNVGLAPATNVVINDLLSSGNGTNYTITGATSSTGETVTVTANGDGASVTLADIAPGEDIFLTLTATADRVGQYCDLASVGSYVDGPFGLTTPSLAGLIPADNSLLDDACFTVTAPELVTTKSLVDANNNEIANNQIVAPNTPVYVRVRVFNNGSAAATGIVANDQFLPAGTSYTRFNGTTATTTTTGLATNYSITTPTNDRGITATLNGDDGFTTAAFDLAVGEQRDFLFQARATADGRYCDNSTFTATGGLPTTGSSDEVCFTVAQPRITFDKVNTSVAGGRAVNQLVPGSAYNSTITFINSGTAAATNVQISDLLGSNAGGQFVNYGSGTYTLSTGTTVNSTGALTISGNTVSAPAINVGPGQTLTVNLTSTIPSNGAAGQYCDTATYTSTNAGTDSDIACVSVANYLAEQTQLVDSVDPITAGGPLTAITATLINEPASNESAINNYVTLNFGSPDAFRSALTDDDGLFTYSNTRVFYNANPRRDPVTGAILVETESDLGAALPTTQYTLTNGDSRGQQIIDFADSFAIAPKGAVFIINDVRAPAGTAARPYYSELRWSNTGSGSGTAFDQYKTESTTVIP